jgi:hypothetical protein
MMDPYLQEAESRRYSCCGVLRLRDGTYAFLAPGYRVVESGITAARLIELIDQYEHNRPLYALGENRFLAEGGRVKRQGAPINLDELED